jgi:lipoate-protein ligase A
MSGSQKDFTKLIRQLRKNGYCVEVRGSGHYAVTSDSGKLLVSLPASSSDHRAIKNAISVLRREGIHFQPKHGISGRKRMKGGE